MTRRERLQNRIERRRMWAKSAASKSQSAWERSNSIVEQIPAGQPILVGHYSEQRHRNALKKSWDALGKAVELERTAQTHESKAHNLEAALDKKIFSDDENAIEALEARIAENEAERELMKQINKLYRAQDAEGLKALGVDYAHLQVTLAARGGYFGRAPYMPYALQNLGQRIQADKKRLQAVKAQQMRSESAKASTHGIVFESGHTYTRITFAEKPDRSILNDLRAAGFHWGAGSWTGKTDAIPASIKQIVTS